MKDRSEHIDLYTKFKALTCQKIEEKLSCLATLLSESSDIE